MYKDMERILISKEQIANRIKQLASQIKKDYEGKRPLLICILKGSVMFFADLIREIDTDIEIDFMAISSYGTGTRTTGEVRMVKDLNHSVEGKDLIIVEDIVDSGLTLTYLKTVLKSRGANSVKIACLLDKPEGRKVEITADYSGFEIEDFFVVGYGLDYAEKYRNLPEVCILDPSVYSSK